MDTGHYVLEDTIVISEADQGDTDLLLRFLGSPNGTLLDRNAPEVTGSRVFSITGNYVQLGDTDRPLRITGANSGIRLSGDGDSVRYCEIYGCPGYGIYISDGRENVIEECNVHSNGKGIHCRPHFDGSTSLIRRNRINNNSEEGIIVPAIYYPDVTYYIENNVIANNGTYGINAHNWQEGQVVYLTGNSITDNGSHGVYARGWTTTFQPHCITLRAIDNYIQVVPGAECFYFVTTFCGVLSGNTCIENIEGEGEGEVPAEGEGEVPNEGEVPVEGEGEIPIEGESELAPEGEGEVEEKTILLPGDVPLELVWIPEGSFLMGRYPGEEGSYDREDPRHEVTLADGFWMGKYEVTQEQWLAVRGAWPDSTHVPSNSYGVGATYPAYYISWDDTQEFLTSLNAHIADTGQGPLMVRLPSEAEWEYACRAGTQTRFYFGDSLGCAGDCSDCAAGVLPGNRTDYMWYCGNNSIVGAKPVGGKRPNAFGLFDMSGNLNEWCEDDWHSTYDGAPVDGSAWVWTPRSSNRVRRGGAWSYETVGCRSALRNVNPSSTRGYHIGFRLAAVTPKPIEEDPYDCPSNGTIAGQPAIPPDQIADQTYYLSDEALWAPGMPLPADNFRAGGEVCGFRWWGVEVDGQGLPCERELTTFVVQVGSDALGWFWEDLVTAEKEAVTEVSFWNDTLNTDVLLTLYKYDVDTVTSCCSLDAEAVDHFVSIRSIFLNGHGETEDEGCYFGWTNSLDGDNTLWAGDFDGTSPYPLPGSDDNLTFCLTGGYPEGEGEGETPVPHPADLNLDYRMVIGEAIAYLAGWQQGANPIAYAIRAAYLWQNGEDYVYDAAQEPPLCWMLPESAEGEEAGEGEGEN